MIDPREFGQQQLELAAEFGKYLFDHPEADEHLPDGAFAFFEITGEPEFNRYSRELAERRRHQEGVPIIRVRIEGLAPPQGSRLLNPVIESTSAA